MSCFARTLDRTSVRAQRGSNPVYEQKRVKWTRENGRVIPRVQVYGAVWISTLPLLTPPLLVETDTKNNGTGKGFVDFIMHSLLPNIPKNSGYILIIDNAPTHRKAHREVSTKYY